jgi:hypothetical protein
MRQSRVSFYDDNVICHLCGFPIPHSVVSPAHPLFGTIDHVIPKSRGGSDCAANRQPAHNCCNGVKAARLLDQEVRAECRYVASKAFLAWPGPVPPRSSRWREVREMLRREGRKEEIRRKAA